MGRFLNADDYTTTGQGVLGNNMFAYCGNDPVAYADPSGYAYINSIKGDQLHALTDDLGGGGGVILVGTWTISAVVADIDDTAKRIIAWIEAQVGKTEFDNHSVYVLIDPEDDLVKYVGRTNNPARRAYEHRNDFLHPWRQYYQMKVVATGLSLDEAMLCEQAFISAFTLGYLENARREIAKNNTAKFNNYLGAVAEIITGIPADTLAELINGR